MDEWQVLYAVLGVGMDASQQEPKAAYGKLVIETHPDKGGSTRLSQWVNKAYAVLGDPMKRRLYAKGKEWYDDA